MAKKKPAAKKGSAPKAAKKPAKAAKKTVAKGKAKAPAKKPVKAVPKKKPAPVAKKVVKAVPKKPVKQVVAKAAPKSITKTAKPAPAQAQPKAAVSKKVEEVKKAAPTAAVKSAPAPAKGAVKKEEAPKKVAAAAPAKNGVPAAPSPAPITIKAPPAAKAKKEVKEKEPFIAVMTGYDPLGGPAKSLKRAAKERYFIEFYLRATPGSLYDLISTPSGFSEWFCDDVDVRGDQFTFQWGSDEQIATCLGRKYGEMIRFHWETDDDPGSFFELRIRIDPMTNETCLVVTDHAWAKDVDESKALWASQIHTLQRVLGA